MSLRLAVLGSGSGTNCQSIFNAIDDGRLDAEVVIVLSDHEDAFILERARRRGVRAEVMDCGGFKNKFPLEVQEALAQGGVNIVALSLADTSEYGMLRMIVSDPNKGKAVLKENGITAMLTDVVALRVPHETGSLSRAMHQIVEGEVNIEYMYAFANGEDASAVLKCDDPARVVDILRGSGFDVWEASEAYVSNIKNAL